MVAKVFLFVFLQLVMSSDQYIQHYEYKEGKVLLYFGEVSKPNDFPISAILDSIYRLLLNPTIIGFTLHYLPVIFVRYYYWTA